MSMFGCRAVVPLYLALFLLVETEVRHVFGFATPFHAFRRRLAAKESTPFSASTSTSTSQLSLSSRRRSGGSRRTSQKQKRRQFNPSNRNGNNNNNSRENQNESDDEQSDILGNRNDSLPMNLRRKIRAKRPALGHIVPQAVRVKGSGGTANPRLRPQGKAREHGLNNPSMLKILSGTAKGRRLDSPQVYLRPMMSKVKEAVFSTFGSFGLYESSTETSTLRHLDIFAGSGSVGLESLSRGASHCTFVDFSDDCCNAIARNMQWCGFGWDEPDNEKCRIVCGDALQVLRHPNSFDIPTAMVPYDLVTMCPPYEEVVYADLMDAVATSPLVGPDTVILVEYPTELGTFPHVIQAKINNLDHQQEKNGDGEEQDEEPVLRHLVGLRNRRYGRTVIAMYIVDPTGDLEGADSRPEEFV